MPTPQTPLRLSEREATALLIATSPGGVEKFARDTVESIEFLYDFTAGVAGKLICAAASFGTGATLFGAGMLAIILQMPHYAGIAEGLFATGLVVTPTAGLGGYQFFKHRFVSVLDEVLQGLPPSTRRQIVTAIGEEFEPKRQIGNLSSNEQRKYKSLLDLCSTVESRVECNETEFTTSLLTLTIDREDFQKRFGDLNDATPQTREQAFAYVVASVRSETAAMYPDLVESLGMDAREIRKEVTDLTPIPDTAARDYAFKDRARQFAKTASDAGLELLLI